MILANIYQTERMQSMNKTYIGLPALCLFLFALPANSVNEFEQWKQQQQQSFQQYKDERDREFTAFLKEHWREMELLKGVVRDEKPKPVVMPVAKPQPPKPEPVPEMRQLEKPVVEEPPVSVKPEPVTITPKPPVPVKPAPVPAQLQKGIRTQVDYFGERITFYYDPAFKRSLPYRLNETALSNFWSELSKTDYEPLLEQINSQGKVLQLNDWGYALLTNKLAEQIYPTSKNKQALFTWFVLTKAGLEAGLLTMNVMYIYWCHQNNGCMKSLTSLLITNVTTPSASMVMAVGRAGCIPMTAIIPVRSKNWI